MAVPDFLELVNPTLVAMHQLGGYTSTKQLRETVAKLIHLSEKDKMELHKPGSGKNETKFSYRLAWARNYLKRYGLLHNCGQRRWELTSKGKATNSVNIEKMMGALQKKV